MAGLYAETLFVHVDASSLADMNHNGKRLRDVDYPRITFHAPDRTFDRLFKEASLHDLRQTVIRKLDLPSDSVISLAQIRGDHTVDLEDEDDFEAFYTVAYSQRVVNVQVRFHRLRPSPLSDDEARPRKKHKKQDMLGPLESGRVKVGAREGKKRKVSFAESSSEGLGHRAVSEEPGRKKRKDDSGSVMAVAVPEPGSSHDSIKKKGKKPEGDTSTASPVPDNDASRHNGTMEVQPTTHGGHDISLEDGQHGESTPSSSHHNERKERGSILSKQSKSAKAKVTPPDVEASSTSDQTLTPSMPGSNDEGRDEQQSASGANDLDGHEGVAVREGDSLTKARNLSDNHDADNADMSSPGADKTENIISSPETGNGSENAAPGTETRNTEKHQSLTEVTVGPITDTQIKDIVSKIIRAKRKEIQADGTTVIPASADTTTSKSVRENGAAGDKKKTPKLTKANSKSKVPACLACSKAPTHDLMDCSVVQDGPLAIQKRIKSLRASKKIPDEEKLSLIQELTKIKNDIKEKAKRNTGKAKVNAQSRSHPSTSRPPDAGGHDVSSDRTKNVAGASPQQRPMNQITPDDREASGTSSDTSSLDAGVQQRAEEKLDGDKSFISPSDGNLSTLASSEDENDGADRMSGELEEDEVEKNHSQSKLLRNESSERSDDDDGDEVPMDFVENHDAAAGTSPDLPSTKDIVNNDLKEPSIPQDANSVDVPDTPNEVTSPVGSGALGDGQPVSDNLNNSVALSKAARPIHEPVAPVENLASSITQALENNSTPITRQSSRRIRGIEVKEANKSTNSSPALRPADQMKHSAAVQEISDEQSIGKRKRGATKTPRKGKEMSLTQALDAVKDDVPKSMNRASSLPARERELRTPARGKLTGKMTRASNGKGKNISAKPQNKTMHKNATTANVEPSDLRTRRSQGQEARKASPSITNWTTLAPAEGDSSIMNDELVPSSPLASTINAGKRAKKKSVKKTLESVPAASSNNDLFSPSESQTPFPFSQKTAMVNLPTRGDSEEEAEVNSSLTPNGQMPHGIRRLSEISGFTKRPSSNLRSSRTSKADEAADLYGRQGKWEDDVEDDSDSGSNSDSESEKKSHIPRGRTAGG